MQMLWVGYLLISSIAPGIPEQGEVVMLLETLDNYAVVVKNIVKWTYCDPVIPKVYD